MNESLEAEVQKLKERNTRVDLDKDWERSLTRRIFIVLITYCVAVVWLYIINEHDIWLKAVVPAAGYILSTISIPQLKRAWLNLKGAE